MSAPKFQKNKVEQTIDLKEVFGIDFKGLRSLREAIGGAILSRIRSRTASGKGMSFSGERGTTVKLKSPYTEKYSKSLDFKAFGKSRGKVNMTLTGDMLGLMDIKKQKDNSITIGWNEREENNKAFNHSTGDTLPPRPFFGISKKELSDIKKKFGKEIREAVDVKESKGGKAFEKKVSKLLALLGDEGG